MDEIARFIQDLNSRQERLRGEAISGLARLLNHGSTATRLRAIEAVATLGDPRATVFLCDRSLRECSELREARIAALTRMGHVAVPELIRALKDPNQRPIAIVALGRIGDPRAVMPLCELLNGKQTPQRTRVAAARALGQIGDPRAALSLCEAALSEVPEEFEARVDAAVEVGILAIPGLVEALNRWTPSRVALQALLRLGNAAVPALCETLRHPDSRVQGRVALVLGSLGNGEAVPELRNVAAGGEYYAQTRAAIALAELGAADESLLPLFRHALDREDGLIRMRAAQALVAFRECAPYAARTLLPQLRRLARAWLIDPNERVGDSADRSCNGPHLESAGAGAGTRPRQREPAAPSRGAVPRRAGSPAPISAGPTGRSSPR